MGTITLTLPISGTIVTAGLHSSNYGAIQTVVNGGLDNNNFASGKIFDNTKIMQGGATDKQALVWSNAGSQWQPATPPGTELGYAEIGASVNVASTSEASGTPIISAAFTSDGGAVWVEFESPAVGTPSSAAGDHTTLSLFEASTQIGRMGRVTTPAAVAHLVPVSVRLRISPAAGSHTYSITAFSSSLTGTPVITAGTPGTAAYRAAFLRITKA